jgi:hypothetical protein
VTALFVVNGTLLVSTVAGGGYIVVQLLRKTTKSSRVPEYDDTYIPLPGIRYFSSFGFKCQFKER